MKTAVKPALKSKTIALGKRYTPLNQREVGNISLQFYQKLFVLLISFSTILIFSDTPRELENICVSYNSNKSCNVW